MSVSARNLIGIAAHLIILSIMSVSAAPDERLTYTMPEGAALLGVSERFLWKQAQLGLIPVVRLGRRTLISRAALLSALERLQSTAKDKAPGEQEQGRLRVMK